MLNVIIVDDEPLLRSGIKHSIHWEYYDMYVIGEASSVREAIQLIQSDIHIDIVFTDMIMPGENGLVLLQWLHEKRPDITPVVLTYYSDFSFVHDALRLGITDYIIKTELYQDAFSKTMTNISLRAKASSHQNQIATLQIGGYCSALAMKNKGNSNCELDMNDFTSSESNHPISQDSWLFLFCNPLDEQYLLKLEKKYCSNWIILSLPVKSYSIIDLVQTVNLYFARDFFYECIPTLNVYHADPSAILKSFPRLSGPEYVALERELSGMSWIRDSKKLNDILDCIKEHRLSSEIVFNLFYCVQSQWCRYFPDDDFPSTVSIVNIKFWYQWLDWIKNYITYSSFLSKASPYSPDIIKSVRSLIPWIEEHFMEDISLTRAAQQANLSSSYLSRCFADFTGYNFSQYLRNLRIDFAKKMLLSSDLSITRIADLCGFQDRFYFDKIFKKEVGISASNYRHQNKVSEETHMP